MIYTLFGSLDFSKSLSIKKKSNTMNDDDAKIGANRFPNGENTIEVRKVTVGKVVPNVKRVLFSASNSIFVFSAMNKASECSKPVLCMSHDNSR